MANKGEENDNLFCSFCGKNQKEVKKLIAGPAVYICDECIQLCSEIIEEESEQDAQEFEHSLVPKEIKSMLDEYVIDPGSWFPGVPPVLSYGVLPFVVLLGFLVGFSWVVRRRFAAGDSETVQAQFVLLLVVFAVFTLVGVWFRGTGMALSWPWNT